MKKIILLVGLLGITLVTTQSKLFTKIVDSSEPELIPTPIPHSQVLGAENVVSLDVDNQKVSAVWYKVSDTSKLKLIPNFSEKQTAKYVQQKYSCKFLTNAGFYKTDKDTNVNSPIGLFISDGKKLESFKQSNLANGVFSINDFATPRITDNVPQDHLDTALQNGPLLVINAKDQSLKIKDDQQKRRVVLGVTGENKVIFIVFYNEGSTFTGPYLSSLPNLIDQFESKTNIKLADAINLDGGSASTFIMDNFSLTEASPIGSFLCEQ